MKAVTVPRCCKDDKSSFQRISDASITPKKKLKYGGRQINNRESVIHRLAVGGIQGYSIF